MINRRFRNDRPFDDAFEVLGKMVECGPRSDAVLWRRDRLDGGEEPYLELGRYGGHYEQHLRSDSYRVTPRVAEELESRGLIIGRPYWGGRHRHELVVSDVGTDWYWAEKRSRQPAVAARETADSPKSAD